MAQKSRSELQGLFKTGAKPSQEDFADFIESTLNIKDDGIEKPSGADTPLKITVQGEDEKLLDFYAGEAKTWSINQKPGENKVGLNISNSGGSKLFIESSSGNVGLSIDQPTAKLHIQQTGNQDALRIDDELKNTTPFLINKDGNVGIGTTSPGAKLDVSGQIKGGGVLAGIWAAQPLNDDTVTSTTWQDVFQTSVPFTLDRSALLFCTYSINVQPARNPGTDYVATRLVVDNEGYRQSGSHFQPLTDGDSNMNLNGNLVLPLTAGSHTVKLQWKKVGNNVASWQSRPSWSDGFIGGRTVVVMAFYQ